MDKEMAHVAAAVGFDKNIAKKLDELLAGPNDRAFVVCTLMDCKLNIKGHCTIFTVLDVPRMKTGQPCEKYEY